MPLTKMILSRAGHFDTLPNLSFGLYILEKSENVYVQVCDFGMGGFGLMVLPAQ